MNRRTFLKGIAVIAVTLGIPPLSFAKNGKVKPEDISDTEIQKLLRCRAAVDEYRKGRPYANETLRTAATKKMNSALQAEGYNGAAEFSDVNDRFNDSEYKKCVAIEGSCDGCPHLTTAPCEIYGIKACKETKPQVAADVVYKIALKGRQERKNRRTDGKTILICPTGHGFYVDESKRLVPRFDYDWKV